LQFKEREIAPTSVTMEDFAARDLHGVSLRLRE
jgi:hypothetical protein